MLDRDGGEGPRLPLHVLTGFLGSGKTALLRALLAETDERIAVLVNEVGDLGLDHHLLERVDEDVLLLPGGCVCCAVRGELHAALARVRALDPDRIVLETTGLADPAPLLHTIGNDPQLRASVALAGVIAVVDCLRVQDLFATHAEVRRQLDFADRLVLTKTDLAPAQRVDDVRTWLEAEAPGREARVADRGRIDAEWLFAAPGFAGSGAGGAGLRAWLVRGGEDASADPLHTAAGATTGEVRHTEFRTHSIRHDRPIDVDALKLWLDLVTQVDGPRLLRVKAIVRSRSDGACFALQAAGRSVSPPQRLRVEPRGLEGAEVVIIERGLPEHARAALLDSLQAALDTNSRERPTTRSD
jgi:G3E family GTPase